MDFYLSIPAITEAIKVYLNTYQTLEEREKTRNTTVTELCVLGWSGAACDAFMVAHEQKMQLYAKLKEDILYMINALQEEKQRALMLKARCEDFVNCIERTGQGGAITGDDEGILSLDFSSQGKINNYVNNCVDDDYVKLNSNFSKIQDILNSLEYTSFGIEGDVDTLKSSVKDQTESLTEFDDSFNVYYAGVKDMESNICSVFSKISANGYSPFQNSSVLAPNGEIATNFLVNAALKTENGFKIENLSAVSSDVDDDSNTENNALKGIGSGIGAALEAALKSVDFNSMLDEVEAGKTRVSEDQLEEMCEKFGYFEKGKITKDLVNQLNHTLNRDVVAGCTNEKLIKNRIRNFLAQGLYESRGGFIEEGSDSYIKSHNYQGGVDYNGVKHDGSDYRGSGFIQVTHYDAYKQFSEYVNDPEILNKGYTYVVEKYPFEISGYWWQDNNMNTIIDKGATMVQVGNAVNQGSWRASGLPDHEEVREEAYKVVDEVLK